VIRGGGSPTVGVLRGRRTAGELFYPLLGVSGRIKALTLMRGARASSLVRWIVGEPELRNHCCTVREVLNATGYLLLTCCQWQTLPKELPPKNTVHSVL
jgi:transposase